MFKVLICIPNKNIANIVLKLTELLILGNYSKFQAIKIN